MSDEKPPQPPQLPQDDAKKVDPNTVANTIPTTHRNRTGITSVTPDAGDAEGGSESGSK